MSHIVKIETQVRDPVAVRAACKRLGLPQPVEGTVKLYSGKATGLAVQLPGWSYPVVFDTAAAKARYDNYGGDWGDQKDLDRFMQIYTVEKAKIEARKRGRSVTEQTLTGGFIKLRVQVTGGAA